MSFSSAERVPHQQVLSGQCAFRNVLGAKQVKLLQFEVKACPSPGDELGLGLAVPAGTLLGLFGRTWGTCEEACLKSLGVCSMPIE